jgi:peptidoglycan/xylan/chitin deacetylase (PgdA/CDA1 family)
MRLLRPVFLAKLFFPEAQFRIATEDKIACLTFDDGPDPDSTPLVLSILQSYGVKSVFFCTGREAEKYPQLVRMINSGGHMTGNHGYSHPDGWKTPVEEYVRDIARADQFTSSSLFRPPYGHLRPGQYRVLRKKYRIVFWDLMAYEFDLSFGKEKALDVLKFNLRPGSLIVLHDSKKYDVAGILSEFIPFALNSGYSFTLPL